jgi:hypothetical protein
MDIVYPLGKGSLYNNFELRMSLRSLEKHLANMGEVWIIGEKPEWLQNVHHIHKHDINTVPDRNMMEKLKVACETPEISEEFLMVHDDHYLLADFDANTFPYFYSEDLKEYVAKRFDQGYGQRAKNSLQHLTEKGLPTLPWATTRQGFIIKSVYSNSTGVIPTLEKDYKINSHPLHSNVKVMSSFPHMRAAVTRFLMETFPTKSRYESSGI